MTIRKQEFTKYMVQHPAPSSPGLRKTNVDGLNKAKHNHTSTVYLVQKKAMAVYTVLHWILHKILHIFYSQTASEFTHILTDCNVKAFQYSIFNSIFVKYIPLCKTHSFSDVTGHKRSIFQNCIYIFVKRYSLI